MIPSDVPVPPRGMMAASAGTKALLPDKELTKRYVYRGWGYDLFDPENAHLVRRPKPFIHPEEVDVVAKWLAEERKRRKPKPRERYVYTPPEPFKLHAVPDPEPEIEEPEPEPRPAYLPGAKPSPGWRPMTGEDIEELMEELWSDETDAVEGWAETGGASTTAPSCSMPPSPGNDNARWKHWATQPRSRTTNENTHAPTSSSTC